MTTAALGLASFTASAEEYYRTNSSGAATGYSHSGKYIVGSEESKKFWMNSSTLVFGMESYIWNTQTNNVEFMTTNPENYPDESEYAKGGCFLGVNDNGVAVGYYKNIDYHANLISAGEETFGYFNCAAYWKDGEIHSLGVGDLVLENCKKFTDGSKAYDISDDSKIIAGTIVTNGKEWPCTWTLQSDGSYKFENLPIPVEEGVTVANGIPTGISADGKVISGYVQIQGNGSIAVVWINREMFMVPPLLEFLENPDKKGMVHQALSVSANGKYLGLCFDKKVPAVYDIEAGKYLTRMEYDSNIIPTKILYLGVNDLGDAVCTLNLTTGSANEKCLIYKHDLERTLTFNYFFNVFAPALNVDDQISLMGISNDGNIFSATKAGFYESSAISISVNNTDVEVPPTPNTIKSKLTGLKQVELSWEAVNNQTKTWNVKEYKIYQDGQLLLTVPYAPFAKDYTYTVEDSKTGYITYYTTIVYENESGATIESPRSEYTKQTVAPNFDFPCCGKEETIWTSNFWTQTYQIPYDVTQPVIWGQWSRMYGFDGGGVGKCSQQCYKPYSAAMESRPIDATNIDENIYVSFPCMWIRNGDNTDFSHEYLSIEVSTDLGETWTEVQTWSGDQLHWRWKFLSADISDLAKGKLFQVRLRRHGEGKACFALLVDYLSINTQVGNPVEGLTSFEKDDENIELIWKNNFGAYDLNYMGSRYGNAYVFAAANAGKQFIAATEYENDKLAPFDGKYISGITTTLNWFDEETRDNPQIDAKILIWEDGKLIREQEITDKRTNTNYVIPLNEPLKIDASKTLRVGISIDNYLPTETPLLYVNSMVYVNGKSDLYSEDNGETWSTLEEAWLDTEKPEDGIGSWMISCDITETPGLQEGAEFDNELTGFNVYRDGEQINTMIVWVLEGRYITPKTEEQAEYQLMPIYKKTGVGPLCDAYVYVPENSGVDSLNDADGLNISYDGDILTINGEFSANAIYNMAGVLLNRLNTKQVNTKDLVPGIYVLQVTDGATARSIKFIKK